MDEPAQPLVDDERTEHAAAPADQPSVSTNFKIFSHIGISVDAAPAASGKAENSAAVSVDPTPPYSEGVPLRTPRRSTLSGYAIYRIQVGAYLEKRNAANACTRLMAAGLAPSFEWYNGYWRVVLTGIRAYEIEDVARRLGAAGFSEMLLRKER
jgi:hypothetical protein